MTVPDNKQAKTLPVSVITTCYGRNKHLYNLLESLQSSSMRPAEVIIVNDDAEDSQLSEFNLNIIKIPTSHCADDDSGSFSVSVHQTTKNSLTNSNKTGFDIGRNRNLGAKHASHDALIFLDVDCVVSYRFLEGLYANLSQHPQSLLMGQPLYLTRPLTSEESSHLTDLSSADKWLSKLAIPNPYRHNVVTDGDSNCTEDSSQNKGVIKSDNYGDFWSLCFAIHRQSFERIGGFDTSYMGYGAEDTDFAFTANQLGIDFYLTDDVVYHQQHAIYRPPLNHLSSIVINANRFYDKWRHWPMAGWLEEFKELGLINWSPNQTAAIEINRYPTEVEMQAAFYPNDAFV